MCEKNMSLQRTDRAPFNADEEKNITSSSVQWKTIVPQSKLEADHEHFFDKALAEKGPFTHVRLTIFPDGGISRLRLTGTIVD